MKKVIYISIIIATAIAAVFVLYNQMTMKHDSSNTSETTLYVASAFTGELQAADGTALPDVNITREVHHKDQTIVHETTTDANGQFSFPEIIEDGFWFTFFRKWLPGTVSIKTTVTATLPEEDITLFKAFKTNLEKDGELGAYGDPDENGGTPVFTAQPINLVCNIATDPDPQNGKSLQVWGVCEERNPGPLSSPSDT